MGLCTIKFRVLIQKFNSSMTSKWTYTFHGHPNSKSKPPFLEGLFLPKSVGPTFLFSFFLFFHFSPSLGTSNYAHKSGSCILTTSPPLHSSTTVDVGHTGDHHSRPSILGGGLACRTTRCPSTTHVPPPSRCNNKQQLLATRRWTQGMTMAVMKCCPALRRHPRRQPAPPQPGSPQGR
jgi:hypothetical protein